VITLQGQSTISCTEVNYLSEIFQGACAIVHTLLLFRLNRILPHYLMDGKIFRKTLLNIKCVFWVSLNLSSKTFLILRRIQRRITINVHKSSCTVPLFSSSINETWILSIDVRKMLIFHENPSSGSRVISCGRKGRRTIVFRNFAYALENRIVNALWRNNRCLRST
jgi:hypothetical protein